MSHGWGANVLVEIQRALLGLNPDDAGYSSFTAAPPPGGLDRASGTLPTPEGTISLSWRRGLGPAMFQLTLTVPPNASATVRIPTPRRSAITEGGQPLSRSAGVSSVTIDHGIAVLHVGAGTYHFAVAG